MDAQFITSAFRQDQYPPADRPEIAIAGRSNVGKSSLINTLVKRRGLAKTSSRPGRTQSINFFLVNGALYLVDLPGYGYARVPIKVKASWKVMVEAYLNTRPNLKAVVVILDIRRDLSAGDKDLLEWLKHHGVPIVLVLTKTDKLSKQKARAQAGRMKAVCAMYTPLDPVLFSSKTRQGRDELWTHITKSIDS
ncbi:MAG: YihA family ribosome biogenesis GTP-binding protein [Thermoplasmata archaeon]|nr:MAG: YihA family ribosome biogenesis GTP-binding protein [Desulfobacteraceae bacterium 4484_190.3]RLB16592.1 MAG: YihA family ribosome biogenesis GTP-binding protein [Deltaproteobacteria bacterium]RLF60446.1 MAG: YihA family ribosome biogenesis GTP-binding protein [Thermoplasmata archaeon]